MASSQDLYYEEKVFPLVKEGKDRFNWWGGLLGFYWFPYKGLWKEWFYYEVLLSIPLSLFMSVEHPAFPNFSLFMKIFTAFLSGVLVVFLGNMSNTFYEKAYGRINDKNVIGRGCLGASVAIILTLPIGLLSEKIASEFISFFVSHL